MRERKVIWLSVKMFILDKIIMLYETQNILFKIKNCCMEKFGVAHICLDINSFTLSISRAFKFSNCVSGDNE